MSAANVQRLVLFDIDGTILHGGRMWAECFMASFHENCPMPAGTARSRISFSGKTDRQISRELMQSSGAWPDHKEPGTDPALEAQVDRILRGYLDRVRTATSTRSHEVKVLPGVVALIEDLRRRPGVTLGLLTGNVREGAALKLGAVGLDQYFEFGVYGDDHWDRYELPAIAVARASAEKQLHVTGKQIVIIGDTIHDIGCGQSIGARAIGVGTGQPDARARVHAAWQGNPLQVGDPRADAFFEDLSDLSAVVAQITGALPRR